MNLQSLDRDQLQRFLYYMTFFEHTEKLRSEGIISRKLKAPTLNDFSNIKKRLSTVMLKALRSSSIYGAGVEYNNENMRVSIGSIARRRKMEQELERYMQFIVSFNVTAARDGMIAVRDNVYDFALVDNTEEKLKIFNYLLPRTQENSLELHLCPDDNRTKFIRWMMENYEIGITTNQIINRDILENPLRGVEIPNLDNDHFSYTWIATEPSPVQKFIYDRGAYRYLDRGSVNLRKVIEKYRHPRFGTREAGANVFREVPSIGNTYDTLFETKIWESGTDEGFEKVMSSNVFINVNRGYSHRRTGADDIEGTVILCKKYPSGNGSTEVIPNVVSSVCKCEVRFSKDTIMNPDRFFTVNKAFVSGIRTHIVGVQNEQ